MGKLIGNWFAHDKKPPELLSPLQKLAREHEEWSASVLTLVPPENCDDERPSESLPNYPAKSLSEVEKKITNLSTELARAHAAAQTGMIHASSALVDLKMERESTTARKTGVKTQQILSNVGIFLEGFSGIAEIIKSADQQFGGLAYGTVQVLATVAARKTEAEDLIEEMLEELAHAFPRLNVLEHIKPTDSLQALLIGAFEVTIAYCRATTEYCKVHSIKRVKKASLERDRMLRAASRLRRKLSEIHKECELLMMQDLKEIRRTLDGMAMQLNESNVRLQEVQAKSRGIHATGEDTNNRVRDGQAWMERQERSRAQKEHLAELRKSLDTRGMTKADDAISKIKDLLRRLSEDDMDGDYGAQMTPEMLKTNKTFKEWDERPESSMLVLGGYNFVIETGSETDSEPDCEEGVSWLSFASAWYTETALRNPGYTLSFFGQLAPTVRKQHRQTFWQVVKTFAFQLAQCTISEKTLEEQVKIISGTDFSSWNDANDVDTIEQMTDLLAALLKTVPADVRITMVIDRLDQCQWDKFTKNGVKDGLEHAARFLLQLVSHRKVGLKILLVVDSRSAVSITRDQSWVGQFLSVPKWHQKAEE